MLGPGDTGSGDAVTAPSKGSVTAFWDRPAIAENEDGPNIQILILRVGAILTFLYGMTLQASIEYDCSRPLFRKVGVQRSTSAPRRTP